MARHVAVADSLYFIVVPQKRVSILAQICGVFHGDLFYRSAEKFLIWQSYLGSAEYITVCVPRIWYGYHGSGEGSSFWIC